MDTTSRMSTTVLNEAYYAMLYLNIFNFPNTLFLFFFSFIIFLSLLQGFCVFLLWEVVDVTISTLKQDPKPSEPISREEQYSYLLKTLKKLFLNRFLKISGRLCNVKCLN